MCGGGGAGGSGTQRYEWNDAIAPYWANALSFGQALTDPEKGQGQYRPYTGQRIADLSKDQQDAMAGIRHFVGAPQDFLYGQGNHELQKTVTGGYLGANPAMEAVNPWRNVNATVRENEYKGDNPYFQQSLQSGLKDITNAYEQGTRADLDKMFTLAGTYGGDAHLKAVANAQDALARNLGRTANEAYQQQFDRSANLDENAVGRELQNQQFNKQVGAGLDEAQLSRLFSGFEGERGRMMGAAQMSQADQGLILQRLNALMGVGDINRSFNQDQLNLAYNNWQEQQNHPFKMLDYFSGLLGRAQGGVSPNMTFTPATYGASPFSQLLGAGLLGYGMFSS